MMAPPIGSISPESTTPTRPTQQNNTPLRAAAQRVRDAQDNQQQKSENTRKANAQVDEARRRLQASKTEEQQAAQRVSAAKADEQQAVRASQRQRGTNIDLVA